MRSDIIISVGNRYINIEMKKVFEKLDELSSDEKMIGLYNVEIKEAKIKRTQMLSVERQSLNRGISQGIEQRNIEIAKNMLIEKFDINTVSRLTGLTREEINL